MEDYRILVFNGEITITISMITTQDGTFLLMIMYIITIYTPTYTASDNIIGKDPLFVNVTNKDFHLQAGSPAINAGLVYSGRNSDADGKSIAGLPDIGAYEYGGAQVADTTPPAAPSGLGVQ